MNIKVHVSFIIVGAEGRTRTGTYGYTLDFESSASANSATSARAMFANEQ